MPGATRQLEHILPGWPASQQGPVPGKDSTALVLRRGRQASTKMHTCVGNRAVEQRLENMASCLSRGTKTQCSSAQTESGCWPHYPVPQSSSEVSLMSPPHPKFQAPLTTRTRVFLSTSSWLFPRQYLSSLVPTHLSLAEERQPTPQPRKNLCRKSVKSQALKLHFLTPSSFGGKSVWGWLWSHTICRKWESYLNCLLLHPLILPSPCLPGLPPLLNPQLLPPAVFQGHPAPLRTSKKVWPTYQKGKHCHGPAEVHRTQEAGDIDWVWTEGSPPMGTRKDHLVFKDPQKWYYKERGKKSSSQVARNMQSFRLLPSPSRKVHTRRFSPRFSDICPTPWCCLAPRLAGFQWGEEGTGWLSACLPCRSLSF